MLREDQRLSTKGRTFRNTATYQKLRGGVPSTPSPCTTVGVWICLYVRLLINPNQNFMDFPYYRSIRKCEKRFVKLFACKTTVLENSFSIKAELSCETKTCRLVTAELRLNVSVNEKEPIPLLRNKTAERRGRQNACMRQTWQVYYLRVLWWSSLKLMFSGLLQKDPFKERGSSAEKFFEQNYFHACYTRYAFFFPLPYCCVSSLLVNLITQPDGRGKKTANLV